MSDVQQIKNISLVFKDTFNIDEIREIVSRTTDTHLPKAKIDKIIRSVVQSSRQAQLSAMENQEIIDSLAKSFSLFDETGYTEDKILGEGAYGKVSQMSKDTTRIAKKVFKTGELESDTIREVGCYSLLTAANTEYSGLVKGISLTPNKISMTFDLANGTLKDLSKELNQQQRIKIFPEVVDKCLESLATLQACNLIHADIKPGNILIWWDKDFTITRLYIADFGLSSSAPDNGSVVYTPPYRAPELWANGKLLANRATDMWAMGMTLVEFLTKSYWKLADIPWGTIDLSSRSAQLRSMLSVNPDDRPVLSIPVLTFPKRDWHIENNDAQRMFRILIPWLYDVSIEFRIDPATFINSIDILCRYCHISGLPNKEDIRGYGLMSLLLASKWGEVFAFKYSDGVYISDRAYTEMQFKKFENKIFDDLHGLVYNPGLENMSEKMQQVWKKTNPVKKLLEEKFVLDHVEFYTVLTDLVDNI